MDKDKKKILGNISEDIHTEIFLIKVNHKFKSVEETLKFLISIYKKDNIREELKREEYINNSNIKEMENEETYKQ